MKKKLSLLLCIAVTLCAMSSTALAVSAEPIKEADPVTAMITAADTLPGVSAYPAEVRASEENGVYRLEKVYYDVAIENEDLANALTVLPDDKRDIVLLAYFLDMTDQEIADKLDMVRRTVQYKRAQSLKELKKEMEVTEDGAQSE